MQYFLIAAVIIVVVILGLAIGVNNKLITRNNPSKAYDLSKELKLESESVVNYGIFKQLDLQNILDNFVVNYSKYIGEDNNVYFVYGDEDYINYTAYSLSDVGEITLDYGNTRTTFSVVAGVLKKGGEKTDGKGAVNVTIENINYPFNLNDGENFFFVIQEPKKQ